MYIPNIFKLNRLLIFTILLTSFRLSCQTTLTKDSFFLTQKNFPKDYETIISSSKWKLLGTCDNKHKKILIPDSSNYENINLFDDGKYYRKIKGNKIVSNSDFGTIKIVYVDQHTLILEYRNKKKVTRQLFRRQV
jgi:hypothetical protein